jgi:hypothetical protein
METMETNFGDPRTMDRKGYPPFEDLQGTDDDTVEDAGVTHRMKPMDKSMDDLMEGSRFEDGITPATAGDGEVTKPR